MKKKLTILFLYFILCTPIAKSEEPTDLIEEGFVTFATRDYFSLLHVLLDSIKAFSTRPIVAFGINADIPFSTEEYPFLIKKRINGVPRSKGQIFTLKPRIMLESGLKYGVYVEADDIVTHLVDELFDICRTVDNYPLCPIHSINVSNQKNIMKLLGVSQKSMPYVHGHVVFAHSCKPFIKEWYNICRAHIHRAFNFDETILNVLFWKHKVTNYLGLYDPYAKYITNYINGTLEEIYMKKYNKPILGPYMFHGYKKPTASRRILNQLTQFAQRSGFSKHKRS